ncbi:hypothetical protein LJC33_06550 [Eubacteriales bacterium OttesenSCG-928-N13]|nr:hypothetical protein [Eubacteriales bacterium OttesenSCG-928-N13]
MQEQKIWTVTIDHGYMNAQPWTSSFSTEAAAMKFKAKAEKKIKAHNIDDFVSAVIDSGYLDSEEYLEWLDETYGNHQEDEEMER